jgi:hypothetical protein
MSRPVKRFVALAPVCLIGMVFSLIQDDWFTAGVFSVLVLNAAVLYRTESRPQRRP